MRQPIERSKWGRHRALTIIILDKWDNRNIHPLSQQNVDSIHREIKKSYITSLIFIQNNN